MLLFLLIGWLIQAHADWENCGCYPFQADSKIQSCVYSYYGCNGVKVINEHIKKPQDNDDFDEDEETNFALRQEAVRQYGYLRQDLEQEPASKAVRIPLTPSYWAED